MWKECLGHDLTSVVVLSRRVEGVPGAEEPRQTEERLDRVEGKRPHRVSQRLASYFLCNSIR